MLSTPTHAALIAIDQASKLPRWTDIERLLDAELTATVDRMIGCREDADLHAFRGRAQFIREFQKLVREAPDTLVKMGVRTPLS